MLCYVDSNGKYLSEKYKIVLGTPFLQNIQTLSSNKLNASLLSI